MFLSFLSTLRYDLKKHLLDILEIPFSEDLVPTLLEDKNPYFPVAVAKFVAAI